VSKNISDTFDLIQGVLAYNPKLSIVIFISALVSMQATRKLALKKKKNKARMGCVKA